jgi:hypothetical protein
MPKKVEIQTKENDASVEEFLNSVADEQRRSDAFRVLEIFKKKTGEEPRMWGPAIIGFGNRKVYRSDGGELDWLVIGFSPRKANLTLYIGLKIDDEYTDLLARLGKHTTGKGCLYINKLSNIDESVLTELIAASYEHHKG